MPSKFHFVRNCISHYLLKASYLFLLAFIAIPGIKAQTSQDSLTSDSTLSIAPKARFHSPRKASILSAVLPGAGQIYNKQYLWAPVFWTAIGTSAYYISYNTKQFKTFKRAYVLASDTIAGNEDPLFAGKSLNYLSQGTEYYRRYRDLSYAFCGLSYLLNIVQASVGAHLFHFNVNDDISLNIQPYSPVAGRPLYGARLVLNL